MNTHLNHQSKNTSISKEKKDCDIIHMTIDQDSLGYASSEILHERRIAMHDLLSENTFKVKQNISPPYHVHMKLRAGQLIFEVYGPVCEHYKKKYTDTSPYSDSLVTHDDDKECVSTKLTNSYGQIIDVYWLIISLTPFQRIIKEYFDICESYFSAVKNLTVQQIETIDMTRRSVHNEASNMLKERLLSKIQLDILTARRLFTLICSLKKRNFV